MLLSILIPGKNDNYRSNGSKTLQFNLQKTIQNLKLLNKDDVEVVLCDWGSEVKITSEIFTEKHKNFRCVYVPPETAKKYNKLANYSIVHPINTAFRNSSGKYVIFWDSDCYITYESFQKLYTFVQHMNNVDDMKFYWGSRFHIPYEVYTSMNNTQQIDNFLANKPNLTHDKINVNNFMGCSISILMNRNIWQQSTGWYEELTYWGWQDIEFHYRLLKRYGFGGDLEDYGIDFYHLNQRTDGTAHNSKTLYNAQINSNNFEANNESWGLVNEKLEIY